MPAPPSFVALPPMPMTIRCAPDAAAVRISSPVPRVDLAPEWIVNASTSHLATRRSHEGKRSPLSPIGERKLDAIRAWPDAPHAASDRARDGDRVGASFERLGSDHHPRRVALGHAGMIGTMRTFFRRAP